MSLFTLYLTRNVYDDTYSVDTGPNQKQLTQLQKEKLFELIKDKSSYTPESNQKYCKI